jgi:hypothetical protein
MGTIFMQHKKKDIYDVSADYSAVKAMASNIIVAAVAANKLSADLIMCLRKCF